ncbi:putative peptide transport system secreted peptide-binding protein [Janibacter sp. HTCC2649]|uniref:peptide ABC transporter substrate-binding protein n=1 Tax=Janibacter sp. HTCC2649 TaxID=313589 RepID=UPI0000670A50|nr:ABC transporter substrate-binding protein [Janibacter sp. HTCC2649]EAP99953.1 putative peptide transport system secreted peptide-binding protein [Janibacter sp. HTCC2649]
MRGTTRTVAVAGISAAALLLAGCGGGGDDTKTDTTAKTGGSISVRGCNPENPLIAGNTSETCGGNVLDVITAKLVKYNVETAAPENDIAESIETTDNQNFTVKLKKDYKFQDGTVVKAKNFVDAWNYTAYGPNAQLGSYFFEPIEGYGDLQSEDPDADGPQKAPAPKAKEMTGLKVVDDSTFTIKTTDKVSNLPVRLGYTAFAPQPDSFFTDPKAFGDKPIAAGPYKLDSWTKNAEIKLSKFADYSGAKKGNVDNITFKIYQDSGAAYADVQANQLDVTDEVPASAQIDDKYKTDLPDRNLQKPVGVIQTITTAPTAVDPNYPPAIRKAISMAINREAIIKAIFNGTRQPATGWVSPVVDGYKKDVCGESCVYDPAKAKAALEAAGGFKGKQITLSYNADSSHKEWTEATCNSIKQALGVNCVATGVVDFSTFRKQIHDRKMTGMFRTGWQMDYPSIENFLTPIYGKGASSNDGDYNNPAFDAKLKEAAAATDAAASNKIYQEAEQILSDDMASIPLWYSTTTMGWSDKVTNVKVTPFGVPDYASISLK